MDSGRLKRIVVNGLVALVVLAIVAAILFPVFVQAKHYSGPGVFGNFRILANGVHIYAIDNDDRFPIAYNWSNVCIPYIKNAGLFTPDFREEVEGDESLVFAMNDAMSAVRATAVPEPSNTILLFMSDLGHLNAHGGWADVGWRNFGETVASYFACTDTSASRVGKSSDASDRLIWVPDLEPTPVE